MKRSPAHSIALWLGLAACACGSQGLPEATTAANADSANGHAVVDDGVRASVDRLGSGRARYMPSIAGASRTTLRVTIENRRTSPLDVANVRTRVVVLRDGVRFPCDGEGGPPARAAEPTQLGPGQTASFERSVDCALPLVGRYRVKVAVAFGRDGAWQRGRDVAEIALHVVAPPDVKPRALEAAPGLWAALGASGVMPAATTEATKEAKGTIVFSLVNGSASTIDVPTMRLLLSVFREANPIPCEDEPMTLAPPRRLSPGRTHTEPLLVSCIGLSKPGNYEVRARLLFTRDGRAFEEPIGRLHVEVSTDPSLIHPPR